MIDHTIRKPKLVEHERYKTTIYPTVLRAVTVESVTVPEGPWTGESYHNPIIASCTMVSMPRMRARPVISISARKREELKDKTVEWYKIELPNLTKKFGKVQSVGQVQNT